ncbi:MAG: helix-turn-helix domain-containing protein [Candidatus Tyrphobacter sp.]
MGKPANKTVLDTIREYRESPEHAESIRTAEIELDLCDKMTELRNDAGLTQAQLAEDTGVTQGYIAKLENGAYDRCGIGTLRRFALALGYDVDLEHLFTPCEGFKWPNQITMAHTADIVSYKNGLEGFTTFLSGTCDDTAAKLVA